MFDDHRLGRRGFVATTAATLFAGCMHDGADGDDGTTNVSENTSNASENTSDTGGALFADQPDALRQQLLTVRDATARYRDVGAALEDGFTIAGPYVPGMGWHLVHEGRAETAAKEGFALEEPQVLVYPETDDGPVLGAAEWAAPAAAVEEEPDLFADDGADAEERWHPLEAAEAVFADGDGEITPPPEIPMDAWLDDDNWIQNRPPANLSAGDTVAADFDGDGEDAERVVDVAAAHPTMTTLHAWVHEENPDGVFAPTNPRFGGDAGHHGGDHHG